MSLLTMDVLEGLRQRRSAGERVSRLAAEVGIPWQKLDKALRHLRTQVATAAPAVSLTPSAQVGPLTERYRPRSLEAILGQPLVVKMLRRFVAAPRPMAFLFEGETGTGKTSAALALAAELGCDVAQAEFGGLWTIASGEQSADTVRAMCGRMWLTPMCGSGWKVFVVNEADRMAKPAEMVWLDQLENLPPRCVVIFTTNDVGNMSDRFRDRCVRLTFASDVSQLRADARRLIAAIWRQETRKSVSSAYVEQILSDSTSNGNLSFRRVVQALQVALMKDGVL